MNEKGMSREEDPADASSKHAHTNTHSFVMILIESITGSIAVACGQVKVAKQRGKEEQHVLVLCLRVG